MQPILLIEDNPQDIFLIERGLKKSGLANPIQVAKDGEQALHQLFGTEAEPPMPLPVVILLDLKLPRLTGLEVLERIRSHERTKLIPVVILTSSDQAVDKLSCYQGGANSFVQKPILFTDFAEKVARIGIYWVATNTVPYEGG